MPPWRESLTWSRELSMRYIVNVYLFVSVHVGWLILWFFPPQVDNPSTPNDEGITPLHNAVCAGHHHIVKFLLDFGVNVNAADSDGWWVGDTEVMLLQRFCAFVADLCCCLFEQDSAPLCRLLQQCPPLQAAGGVRCRHLCQHYQRCRDCCG